MSSGNPSGKGGKLAVDTQQEREYKRQQAIDEAVLAADRIILNASDGSLEETNYLTAQVAKRFVDKATHPIDMALLQRDLTT